MTNLPLLSDYKIKLLTYDKMRARKLISFSHPCIGYLLRGTAEFWLNGQSYTAKEGDLIYIAAETEYYSLWIGDPQVQWYSVNFTFTDPLAFADFRFQILKSYPVAVLNEMFAQQERDPLSSLSAFYTLLSDLYARMERSNYTPKFAKIRPAVDYLKAHYTQPVTVTELAAMCGYSEAHFYTLFQELMQVSPIVYKNNLLVQQAMRDLLETNDSLDTIAARLGFSSTNYFSRVFTKTVKKTPGEVRRAARAQKRKEPAAT
jgi:AraC-like DNA-binding protein